MTSDERGALTGSGNDESDTGEGHDSGRGLGGGHAEGRLFVYSSSAVKDRDAKVSRVYEEVGVYLMNTHAAKEQPKTKRMLERILPNMDV